MQQLRDFLVRALHSAHFSVVAEPQVEDALDVLLCELTPEMESKGLLFAVAHYSNSLCGLDELD